MAITQVWKRFGDSILAMPHLTLAAFLGHAPSIAIAKESSIRFPRTADFQIDPAYDPNIHRLDLDEDYLSSKFLLKCISTWGAEPLIRAANACSLLQCMHHASCHPKYRLLRNEAAFALQNLVDAATPKARLTADEIRRNCESHHSLNENVPNSPEAHVCWYHLGAAWFGLETALGNMEARNELNEGEHAPSNSSWIARQTVWPERAIDAAAHWSSHSLAVLAVKSTLIAWAARAPDRAHHP
jgi:hypothetical protein